MRLALEILAGVHIYAAVLVCLILPFKAPELLAPFFPRPRRRRRHRLPQHVTIAAGTGLGGPLGGVIGGALGQLFNQQLGGPPQ